MKVDKVIFGVDNSYFLEFWPIQSKICREVLGVEPVLFFICDEETDFYDDGYGLVKKIKKVGTKNTGLLACIVRLFGTKYFPNEVCVTGDLDLLMINKKYFTHDIEKYNNDSLVIFTSDAYDLNRPECQQLFDSEPFPFKQEMYNYPYYAAKGSIFNKIVDTDCSFEEFVSRHENYKPGYKFMWMIDEFYFSDCVNNKNHGVEVHKLKRGFTSPWLANKRINRHNFPVDLPYSNEVEMQKKDGIYDIEKLRSGYYIDANCCRPYSKFKHAIDDLIGIILENKNLVWWDCRDATDLCKIMKKHGSDKSCKPDWVDYQGHNYTTYYSELFEKFQNKDINLFELGLGTNDPHIPSNMGVRGTPGASLRGWKEYFPMAQVYGADIDNKILFQEDRIQTFYCDQTQSEEIKNMWEVISEDFDIIIDDGLHDFDANLIFLKNSFHKLKNNGVYVVEDVKNSEIELWKKEINSLSKIYSNCDFSIVKLDSKENKEDNNLVVIQKQMKIDNSMKDIEIINFEKEEGKIFFSYKGTTEENVKVCISWRNYTIYRADMTLSPNPSVIYFVGSTEINSDFIDTIDVTFYFKTKKQTEAFYIKPTTIEPHQLSTLFEDTSYYSYKEIFIDKIYDNNEVKIEKNDIVVDIGANLGFFSVYAKEKEPSKIYCFEPSEELYDSLKTNIGFDKNFVFQKAISGEDGKNNFLYYDISSASGRLCNNEEGGYEVETIGVNNLIKFLGVDKINYLKIDCEGCEKNIFENITKETISKIDKMVIEYHSEEIKELIIRKLNEFGVEINKIENQLIFAHQKKQSNPPKKKIVLISSFCDNQKKMDVLKENLIKLKSLNLDTMVIVPNFLPVDEEIIKLSDFVFYTKENPLLKYPIRQYTHWYEKQLPDGRVTTLHRGFADYGWAALYQTKKLSQIALTFDYDLFYHLIYDVEIDDVLVSELSKNDANIIHPRRNPNHPDEIWECTLHFMVFDRDMMSKIEKEITLEEYMSTNGVAEGEVLKWTKKFDIKTSEHCVKDKIFYWENFDFFNVSPFPEFKMFLSKNPELKIWLGYETPYSELLPTNLRIVFHEIPDGTKVDVVVNGENYSLSPKNWEIIEIPVDSQSIKEIIFIYDGKNYDFTKEYSEIMLNQVFYNIRN